jgi:hypothetical protein
MPTLAEAAAAVAQANILAGSQTGMRLACQRPNPSFSSPPSSSSNLTAASPSNPHVARAAAAAEAEAAIAAADAARVKSMKANAALVAAAAAMRASNGTPSSNVSSRMQQQQQEGDAVLADLEHRERDSEREAGYRERERSPVRNPGNIAGEHGLLAPGRLSVRTRNSSTWQQQQQQQQQRHSSRSFADAISSF